MLLLTIVAHFTLVIGLIISNRIIGLRDYNYSLNGTQELVMTYTEQHLPNGTAGIDCSNLVVSVRIHLVG